MVIQAAIHGYVRNDEQSFDRHRKDALQILQGHPCNFEIILAIKSSICPDYNVSRGYIQFQYTDVMKWYPEEVF